MASDAMQFGLSVVLIKERACYAAYLPALDLTTHGESIDDALAAAVEAARIFLEELIHMGTVDDVLTDLGWQPVASSTASVPYVPPEVLVAGQQQVQITCPA